MTGALYWQRYGNMEVGGYIDTEAKPRVAVRGVGSDLSLEQAEALTNMIRAVATCLKHADHTDEMKRTGECHVIVR